MSVRVLCLRSGQYSAEKRKEVPLALRLLPLLPADAIPVQPDTDRPYKFTVISTTPGVKPLALGVVGEYMKLQLCCNGCKAPTF